VICDRFGAGTWHPRGCVPIAGTPDQCALETLLGGANGAVVHVATMTFVRRLVAVCRLLAQSGHASSERAIPATARITELRGNARTAAIWPQISLDVSGRISDWGKVIRLVSMHPWRLSRPNVCSWPRLEPRPKSMGIEIWVNVFLRSQFWLGCFPRLP
jgi:hypothetical protein